LAYVFDLVVYPSKTGGGMAGLGSGRIAKPLPLRAAPGGNAGKLQVSNDFKPGKLTAENADQWREELLTLPLEKKLWDLYIMEMRPYNLLAGIDAAMLSALCIEQAIYFTAARECGDAAHRGEWNKLVFEKSGNYRGPMAIGNKSFEKVLALSAQFGAMPAARVKLAAVSAQMSFDFGSDEAHDPHIAEAKKDRLLKLVQLTEAA
jgi:phage terminase small subunit